MMERLEGLQNGRTRGVVVQVPERPLRTFSVEDMKDEWVAGILWCSDNYSL
jgi:hypothetical protein